MINKIDAILIKTWTSVALSLYVSILVFMAAVSHTSGSPLDADQLALLTAAFRHYGMWMMGNG